MEKPLPPRSPKNWRKSGSTPSGPSKPVFTTFEDETATTAGSTFLTTGAKLTRLAGSFGSANFKVAGAFAMRSALMSAAPPRLRLTAAATAAERTQNPCAFMYFKTSNDDLLPPGSGDSISSTSLLKTYGTEFRLHPSCYGTLTRIYKSERNTRRF